VLVRRWIIRLSLKPVWHGFDKGEVGREWTVANLAEAVLYLMAVDRKSGGDTRRVDERGPEHKPQKSHIIFLENRKVKFCFATVLMTLVQEAARSTKKAGVDMIECLKLWRKVRLG
jgi:hypothetical protein